MQKYYWVVMIFYPISPFPSILQKKVKAKSMSWSYQVLKQAGYWKVAERLCGRIIVFNFEQVKTLIAAL